MVKPNEHTDDRSTFDPRSVEDQCETLSAAASTWEICLRSWLSGDSTSDPIPTHSAGPRLRRVATHFVSTFGPVESEPCVVPQKVGRYRIERLLGRGGMGEVYLANDPSRNRRVAIKFALINDENSSQALHREAAALARIRHDNIVSLIDYGMKDGLVYLILEYIDGKSLREIVAEWFPERREDFDLDLSEESGRARAGHWQRRNRIEWRQRRNRVRQAVEWFRDLTWALVALHSEHKVHRDIKPANVIISNDQKPFLIDFGLMVTEASTTSIHGVLAGTLPYMSPEQTHGGLVAIGPQSDLYSLAVTFHEVLTGQRVAEHSGRLEILEEVAFQRVRPPSEVCAWVPKSLDPVFEKALDKNPRLRYQCAEELAADLNAWLEDRDFPHASERRSTLVLRRIRRRPICATLVVFVIGISLGAMIMFTVESVRRRNAFYLQVRQATERGDHEKALHLLRGGSSEHADEVDWQIAVREAASGTARHRTQVMLATVGVIESSQVDTSEAGRFGREALDIIQWHWDPHFAFQAALFYYLKQDYQAAERSLDRSRTNPDPTPLLVEMRRLIELELAAATLESPTKIYKSESKPMRGLTPEEIAFHALRLLREAQLGSRVYLAFGPDERRLLYDEALDAATWVSEGRETANLRLAHLVKALALFGLDYFERAARAFEELHRLAPEPRILWRLQVSRARHLVQCNVGTEDYDSWALMVEEDREGMAEILYADCDEDDPASVRAHGKLAEAALRNWNVSDLRGVGEMAAVLELAVREAHQSGALEFMMRAALASSRWTTALAASESLDLVHSIQRMGIFFAVGQYAEQTPLDDRATRMLRDLLHGLAEDPASPPIQEFPLEVARRLVEVLLDMSARPGDNGVKETPSWRSLVDLCRETELRHFTQGQPPEVAADFRGVQEFATKILEQWQERLRERSNP